MNAAKNWLGIRPISSAELTAFEDHFDFRITPVFRTWLLEHNAGFPKNIELPTTKRMREFRRVLDFSNRTGKLEAWKCTERCRDSLGSTRIPFGFDAGGNFVCLERHYRHQQIVVWNHITDEFEPCLLDIPTFIKYMG